MEAIAQVIDNRLEGVGELYPEKFASEEAIFSKIHPGARIFIGTGCGEPQYLVHALMEYVESHPKALLDAELFHLVALGVTPYTSAKFKPNFRHNSFFIGGSIRDAVNHGMADYTPIFLSKVPELFSSGMMPLDIALIQTSPPDKHGYMSLGVSVDIVKAAISKARIIIAQVNSNMPKVHGDGFIHIRDVNFIVPHDEPVLEYSVSTDDGIVQRIGKYVSRLVQDGDTIQVGYGSIPNAILSHLQDKKHLGVHTELLSDGIIDLMKRGVVDNSKKNINCNKTIASFCMGKRDSYEYIHDNAAVELKTIDYTNNPLVIAQHANMTAINSALELDLTGQATAESLGDTFYSGIGGQADFMRGAILAPRGKTILTIQSTAQNGQVSRIVPFLKKGAGVTLNRGDVRYVVTEYGIAYLHGKNIRERAMALIAIAHPKFRHWLIEEAKKRHLIYDDQAFIPGKSGEYPEDMETHRVTKTGLNIFLRSVKISDEPLLKEFIYALSEQSMYRRFVSARRDMPHELLQDFVVIDYTKETAILAVMEKDGKEEVIGAGWYFLDEAVHTAEVAFAVRDKYQNRGIGTELLSYLTYLAKKQGLLGCFAEVTTENQPMRHIFDKAGFETVKTDASMCEMRLDLQGRQ